MLRVSHNSLAYLHVTLPVNVESIEVSRWGRIMIEAKFSNNNSSHSKEDKVRKN